MLLLCVCVCMCEGKCSTYNHIVWKRLSANASVGTICMNGGEKSLLCACIAAWLLLLLLWLWKCWMNTFVRVHRKKCAEYILMLFYPSLFVCGCVFRVRRAEKLCFSFRLASYMWRSSLSPQPKFFAPDVTCVTWINRC